MFKSHQWAISWQSVVSSVALDVLLSSENIEATKTTLHKSLSLSVFLSLELLVFHPLSRQFNSFYSGKEIQWEELRDLF